MRNRYKPGLHPIYDGEIDRITKLSSFLGTRGAHQDVASLLAGGKRGIQSLLVEYQGKVEAAADLLGKIADAFEDEKIRARREGKTEPSEPSRTLLDEQYRAEALHDVRAAELEIIRGMLVKIEDREQAEKDDKVLQYGPLQMGRLRDGVLAELDGQAVEADKNGVLIINCPKSPYHKMKVSDYREKVAEPWRKARSRERQERIAFLETKRKKKTATVSEMAELHRLSNPTGVSLVSRADLPARPEGV